ncbi:MAG: hypothetical protein QGG73_10095, partial [Candidatus Hydrogenedentes bacterium]|nr:hypothetical protein [Candidatus Hydrogenedentota bacterium]
QEPASSNLVKVKAEGFAQGSSLNSRSRAIAVAERKSLELFLTHYVGLSDLRIARPIVEASSLYAKSSRLLEYNYANGGTRVLVEVYLQAERTRGDLANLIFREMAEKPAVLLMIAENVADGPPLSQRTLGNAEDVFSKAFRQAGFELIDPFAPRRAFTRSQLLSIVGGSENEAAQLGLAMGADVVVLGEAEYDAKAGAGAGNLRLFSATLRLRAVRSRDGALLDKRTTTAAVQSRVTRDGAAMATRDAAAKQQNAMMVASVLGVYGQSVPSSGVTLRVENVQDSRLLRVVEEAIAKIGGVSRVELKRLFQGTAVMQISYEGKIVGLTDAIEEIRGPGFRMDLTQGVGRELVCRVVDI